MDVISSLRAGEISTIIDGPLVADELTWWKIDKGGWVAQAGPDGDAILDLVSDAGGLRIGWPCDRDKISQLFGENPDFYSQIQGYPVPLRGHNGIDFGVYVGTPVRATDDGAVQEVREDTTGFGLMVMIRHSWGVSLYAHLSNALVAGGQGVSRGQVIAFSGQSGMSMGNGPSPHLHFGVKINPWDRADGWGGYSDPMLYLEG